MSNSSDLIPLPESPDLSNFSALRMLQLIDEAALRRGPISRDEPFQGCSGNADCTVVDKNGLCTAATLSCLPELAKVTGTCGNTSCPGNCVMCVGGGACATEKDCPTPACEDSACQLDANGACSKTCDAAVCKEGQCATSPVQKPCGPAADYCPGNCRTVRDCPSAGNACQNSVCQDGHCELVNNTASCDDKNKCTSEDQCAEGSCTGTPKACASDNVCYDASCNPQTGSCVLKANTASCDDGSLCTENDKCSNGKCAGSAVSCNDGISCTEDTCDPNMGCRYTPVNGRCPDDGKFCTEEICDAAMGCVRRAKLGCQEPCTSNENCESIQECVNNVCVDKCPSGQVRCNGVCVSGNCCATTDCAPPVQSCTSCRLLGANLCGKQCPQSVCAANRCEVVWDTVACEAAQCNQPPLATADTFETPRNTARTVNVAANDTDPDNNQNLQSVRIVDAPANGSAVASGGGNIRYTPAAGHTGTDIFSYEICDAAGACATANVLVTVTALGEKCGNFFVDPDEQCDDGNTANGDGCSSICRWEPCTAGQGRCNGVCVSGGAECCDAGDCSARPGECRKLICNGNQKCEEVADSGKAGEPCGDKVTDTVCDKPDTCDSNGACRSNYAAASRPCEDGKSCSTNDHCDGAGRCAVGTLNDNACQFGGVCNGTEVCAPQDSRSNPSSGCLEGPPVRCPVSGRDPGGSMCEEPGECVCPAGQYNCHGQCVPDATRCDC
ncbi:MAG: Ig-like domain-containing protein, partial [Candidatus Omnitrophota bacterium]